MQLDDENRQCDLSYDDVDLSDTQYSVTQASSTLEVTKWHRSNQQTYVSYQSRIASPTRPTNRHVRRRTHGIASHAISLSRHRHVPRSLSPHQI